VSCTSPGQSCSPTSGACVCTTTPQDSCKANDPTTHCDNVSWNCIDNCSGVACDPGESCAPLTAACACTSSSCLTGYVCGSDHHCAVDCSASLTHPFHIAITGGDAMVAMTMWPAGAPLEVQVTDSGGKPAPCVAISWAATVGSPGLNPLQSTTGPDGKATTNFRGGATVNSWETSQVTATMVDGSANFTETSCNTGPPGQLFQPAAILQQPTGGTLGTVQAGALLAAAIKVQIGAAAGPQTGQGIPDIGLRVANDPGQAGPSIAWCSGGLPLTDASGVASCNLQVGTWTGTGQVRVTLGEATYWTLSVTVTP
jgi:hypothetical protein